MGLILPVGLIIVLIVAANVAAARRNGALAAAFDGALLLFNLPLVLVGLALLAAPPDAAADLAALSGLPLLDLAAAGWVTLGMGAWGVLSCLRPARRLLARALPLDPLSPVHALALALVGYLVGNTALTLTQGGLQELAEAAITVSLLDVVVQQALFVLAALFGVGFLVRRNGRDLQARLGLERPTAAQLRLGLRWIVLLVLLQWAIGAAWALLDPEQAELLGSINESMLAGFNTLGDWFVLALAAGVGEEILFRGALQPVLGLGFTSLLFAIVHVQYGITPITFAVFLIGLAIGVLRQRTNTTVAIFVHFGYNFVLGLLSLLAVYLERFVA